MATRSLLPIDCGFDPRLHDMTIDLSDPDIDHVEYEDADGNVAEVQGSKTKIAGTLADAGFCRIIVEHTPNGREIAYEAADRPVP